MIIGGTNWPATFPVINTVKRSLSSSDLSWTTLLPFLTKTLEPLGETKNAYSSVLKILLGLVILTFVDAKYSSISVNQFRIFCSVTFAREADKFCDKRSLICGCLWRNPSSQWRPGLIFENLVGCSKSFINRATLSNNWSLVTGKPICRIFIIHCVNNASSSTVNTVGAPSLLHSSG